MKKERKIAVFISLTFALLLQGFTLFGQENKNSKVLKLYSNFGWISTENTIRADTSLNFITVRNKQTQMGYLSPSIAFVLPNGNFQELELSKFRINNTNNESILINDSTGKPIQMLSGQRTTNILVAFRYEYDILLLKKKEEAKFRYYLGFAINPYFSNTKSLPKIATSFPTRQNNFGTMLAIIPRINYNLSDKWFLDIDIPFNIIDINWTSSIDDSPSLPINQRRTTVINLEVIPNNFLLRIGLGLRI